MEELSFSYSEIYNMGGPPIPNYISLGTMLNQELSASQKRAAYQTYINNHGYPLFDFTKITDTTAGNLIAVVSNTSFYVFFTIFMILLILFIMMIVMNIVPAMLGMYFITILSLFIYVMSVLYRQRTLSKITSATVVVNDDIVKNKMAFDNSVIQLPNNIIKLADKLNEVPDNTMDT